MGREYPSDTGLVWCNWLKRFRGVASAGELSPNFGGAVAAPSGN